MRFRFPLFVKKRGERRTASDRMGRWGELLFYLFFFIAGGLVMAWHVNWVMVPDWQARLDVSGLRPAVCRLVDKRIATRETVKGHDYRAELLLAPRNDSSEGHANWSYDRTGEYSPSRDDAQRTLEHYEIGKNYNCWIDPADPTRIMLDRDYRWWPWLVVLIPASLLLFGAVGCIRTFRHWNSSHEWQALSQQMSSFDLGAMEPAAESRPGAVPSIARAIDSPGVRLAYRLPIDGSPNWRLAAMGVVCLCWNALVVFFLQQLIFQFRGGMTNWIIAALVVPFAVAGIWLIVLLVREAWNVIGIGTTHLEIARHPLHPGCEYGLFLMQSGQMHVRLLNVWLLCEERSVFQEGTDTRAWVETVHREVVLHERNFAIERGRPFEMQFSLTIPPSAMHSFRSDHNEVRWSLEVRGTTHRWPEFQRRFPLCVYPLRPNDGLDGSTTDAPEPQVAET